MRCFQFFFAIILSSPLVFTTSFAQSRYELSWKQDAILLGGGAAGTGIGYLLMDKISPLNAIQVNALSRDNVNTYDRQATYNYSQHLSDLSDVALISVGTAPLFLLAGKEMRKDWFTLGVMYSETALLTTALVSITKGAVVRNRPFVYNPDAPMDKKLEKDARTSFFSGHTAFTFATATFFSTVYGKYYPSSALRPYLTGAVYGAAAVTAYLRYESGKHFQSDILTGAIVGTAVGYLIPAIHETEGQEEVIPFSLTPGVNMVTLTVPF